MPTIKFVTHDGDETVIEVDSGTTVMSAAIDNGIDAILGDCGGACSCATCHCFVDESWFDKVGPATGVEKEMVESAVDPKENSRLGCQVVVDDSTDGIVIHLPESQY